MRATHDSDGATGPSAIRARSAPAPMPASPLVHSAGRGRGLRDLDDGHVRGAEGAASGVGVAGVGGSPGPAASDLRWRRHGRRGCGDPAVRVRRWWLIANPGGRDRTVRPVAGQRAPRGSWPRGGARRPRPYISRASSRSSRPHSRRLQAQRAPLPTRGPATSGRGGEPARCSERTTSERLGRRPPDARLGRAPSASRRAIGPPLAPASVDRSSARLATDIHGGCRTNHARWRNPQRASVLPWGRGTTPKQDGSSQPRGSSPRVGQSAAGSGGHAHTRVAVGARSASRWR